MHAARTFGFWLRVLVLQLLIVYCSLFVTRAQVPNDDIERRQELKLNQTIRSNTTGCSVQWSCVDEKLTGKCIEYHNDQWFAFTPRAAGRYYVNIGGQKCRDTRGVQLVVLTGTPCQPATYRVLSCTSLGSQDDVFVTLDSLRAGQPYLLNIDGYLKDFCQFTLAVSDKPQGVPALALPALAAAVPSQSKLFTLRWLLPDSLGTAARFRVLRREAHEFRAAPLAEVPVTRTTYGANQTEYAWTDTLTAPGRYLYQVVADATDAAAPTLVQQQWYAYSQLMPQPGYFSGESARAAQKASEAQKNWERRSHQARLKRLSRLRRGAKP